MDAAEESNASDDESLDEIGDADKENSNSKTVISKYHTIWSQDPFVDLGRVRKVNVITLKPGVTRYASARVHDIKSSFLLFFPNHLQKIILENTNRWGRFKNKDAQIETDYELT